MNIEEAEKIVNVWGKYLEYCGGKLSIIFLFGKIPESLLPYPKSILIEALNLMDKYFFDIQDEHKMKSIRETIAELEQYTDDQRALMQAAEAFEDKEKKELIITTLKNFQQEWIKTQ